MFMECGSLAAAFTDSTGHCGRVVSCHPEPACRKQAKREICLFAVLSCISETFLDARRRPPEFLPLIVLLMGSAGSGKTTVGELLAKQLSWEFADADEFHSPANIEKMSRGIGLTDEDRVPWLKSIHEKMLQWQAQGQNVVLACSALKRSYRELLRISSNAKELKLVYLKASYDLLLERLRSRKGHYATEQLLASQLADLEEPGNHALTLDAAKSPEVIVSEIRKRLRL